MSRRSALTKFSALFRADAQTSLRAAVFVLLLLGVSFLITGFVTSAYKRERQFLGQTHYDQGQSLTKAGELADAVGEYRRALIFNSDSAEYRLSLATALLNTGRLDEAQAHLDQLLQEDPTNGVINLMLARLAMKRHHLQQATGYYQRAVYEYWPASSIGTRRQARWELVGLLEKTGRRNEVVGELMQLYASAPPDPSERAKIGFLLLQYGATSEASQAFRDIVREAPQDGSAHRGLGDVYLSAGSFVSARHEFQRALRLDPNDGQSSDALALTNTIIDLDPALPGITSAERLRRSQNLLGRVVNQLQQCPEAGALQDRLDAARKMLEGKNSGDADVALALQNEGQQLWKDRAQFCGTTNISDRALEIVLGKIGHE
ncbi:MAG: tetratricopeptide repeat protein [Acidobacteriaceae bacterium]|nr:tetratricopeptide repeat protein [Acidobacteriaceae bacterium]